MNPFKRSEPTTAAPGTGPRTQLTSPPAEGSRDLVPPQFVPRNHRSAAYAEAQQRWDEMEAEISYLKDQVSGLKGQCKTLEEAGKLLNQSMALLKQDNERLVRENTRMNERVRAAADVLVGLNEAHSQAHRDAFVGSPVYAEHSRTEVEALAAVESALHHEPFAEPIEMPHPDVIPVREPRERS